jgi:hypothetical protein
MQQDNIYNKKQAKKQYSEYLHVTNTKTIVPRTLLGRTVTIFECFDMPFSMHALCCKY